MQKVIIQVTAHSAKFICIGIYNASITVNPNDVVDWLKLLPQIVIAIHGIISIFKSKKPKTNGNQTTKTN